MRKQEEQEQEERRDLVPVEDEGEDYTLHVVLFFGGSVPLVALTQMLGLGVTGFVTAAVVAGILAVSGPELGKRFRSRDRLPGGFDWQRLAAALSNEGNIVEADPAPQTDEDQAEEWSEEWYDQDDDFMPVDQSMFTFSQLLASGFRPTLHKIFLGRLSDGTDIFVEAKDLCHVALAGNTGHGKSSLLRLIMAQLCSIRVNVVLLTPHYMVYDHDHDEDWTPFTPYLARHPLDYVKAENIAYMLKWIIDKTLARRMELARSGKSVGKPYFVVIDELPAIVGERKECAGYIAKLLREGRKYGLYLIVASTDFQVKTIGMDTTGGAVRKNFRTACYVGGDSTTANVLLEKQAPPIPETDLGKGAMMLRCAATGKAVLARVPYCDNAALYLLLGPSTFVASAPSSASLPLRFQSSEQQLDTEALEAAQEADGSDASGAEEITDLSTMKALREIGKRLKAGEDPAAIVKSFGLPYGRATQEMSAVVDMVAHQIERKG